VNIGFIGLGAMGSLMLRRLAKAYPDTTFGFDKDADITASVTGNTGAQPTSSVAEIAGLSDVLFSCVPDNDVLRSVYLGDQGVCSTFRAGAISIDCSTVGPDATREVYAGVQACGASHLDASMLGSIKQATEGTISFVVGGDAEAFERAQPVLSLCGELIRHCGDSGAGNHMKLIHQTLVAGHAVAVAEAMGLCLETGADINAFYDIVTQGTGFAYSRYFENRVPRMQAGDFSALFMLKFMLKDARLAREMVDDSTPNYPALDAVIRTLTEGVDAGWADADFSAAMKAVEARIGKQIAVTGGA